MSRKRVCFHQNSNNNHLQRTTYNQHSSSSHSSTSGCKGKEGHRSRLKTTTTRLFNVEWNCVQQGEVIAMKCICRRRRRYLFK